MRSACSGQARQLSRQRIRLKYEQVVSPLEFAVNFATPVWLNASPHVEALERRVSRNLKHIKCEERGGEKRDWVALTDVLTNVCLSFCRLVRLILKCVLRTCWMFYSDRLVFFPPNVVSVSCTICYLTDLFLFSFSF